MNEKLLWQITWGWILLALVLIPVLLKIRAPYGRYARKGWGAMIPNRISWILMELPSLVLFALFFLIPDKEHDFATWILFGLWMFHYMHRALIYPVRTRTRGKKMPLGVMLFAVVFNLINAFLNGYYLGAIRPTFTGMRLLRIGFWIGILLFAVGFAINFWSDNKLLHLRQAPGNGYKIPHGGLFRWISCPNYFGEILEWTGFAIAAASLPAVSFAIWTFANLFPRAVANHRWYHEQFPDYPEKRKALIPWII